MVKEDLRVPLAELDVILNAVVPEEEKNKISTDFLEYIHNNKAQDVPFEYDFSKEINEQKVHEDTYVLLGILFLKYWATDEERTAAKKVLEENERIYQKEKNNDKVVDNNNGLEINDDVDKIEENIQLPTVYKESFIQKIISSIKKFFKRGKE